MGLFTRERPRVVRPPVKAPKPAAVPVKPPVVEGWSESELVNVYNAAPVRHLAKGESLFEEASESDSFFVLLDGAIQVVVKLHDQPGRPGIFRRGDVVAPLPKAAGLSYCAEAATAATIIEIPPAVMSHLPEKTQLSIYKVTVASTSK